MRRKTVIYVEGEQKSTINFFVYLLNSFLPSIWVALRRRLSSPGWLIDDQGYRGACTDPHQTGQHGENGGADDDNRRHYARVVASFRHG